MNQCAAVNSDNMSLVMRKPAFAYVKTKTQISFAVTAKLISAFVFATWIVQYLYFLNPKFQASSYILWLHSPVCVGPGLKPRRPVFSQRGSYYRSRTRVFVNRFLICTNTGVMYQNHFLCCQPSLYCTKWLSRSNNSK